MSPSAREYVYDLGEDCRLRHRHVRLKDKVVDFSVQVEIKIKSAWHPIVRYDTAHGFAHKDLLHADGRAEKVPLFMQDYNEPLTFAEADLKSNWALYRDRYIQEVGEP